MEFPEGVGFSEKNPIRMGGMDIFWSYTFLFLLKVNVIVKKFLMSITVSPVPVGIDMTV